ncbi:uncharacterized protein LOC133913853 [Phragmites australis]|uniref:uncharacterized protein LOC133913853 n=1 Tax=Phragmites australis TaxID=29695 RepID=UPI002D786AC7|nr:uncharacterized protein LOC133913853 [Phragmites australis]
MESATGTTRLLAALLCCVLLATAPLPAQGNCRDECVAAGCNGSWGFICQLSCTSACMGQIGISTLSVASPENNSAAAQEGGAVSVLRGLKPADDGPKN